MLIEKNTDFRKKNDVGFLKSVLLNRELLKDLFLKVLSSQRKTHKINLEILKTTCVTFTQCSTKKKKISADILIITMTTF